VWGDWVEGSEIPKETGSGSKSRTRLKQDSGALLLRLTISNLLDV
jgi:hypothetical protein